MSSRTESNNSKSSHQDYTYRHYLVAFLDILGQKDRLRKIKALPQNEQEHESFVKLVKQTHGTVVNFRKSFLGFFDSMYKPRPTPPCLTTEQMEKYKEIKRRAEELKPTVISFSDSIIVYVPLSDDEEVVQVDGILSTMLAISGSFLLSISSGYIFRGGFEIGLGCRITANEIYGPALVKAYDLESKVAKYPRIVAGNELVDFLHMEVRNKERDVQSEVNKVMAQKCLNLLMEDADGRYALDYLGQEYRDMTKGKALFPDLYGKASSFLEKSFLEIKENRDSNLFLQYLWLADYFENRLPLWQEPDQE
jgi:hypothetical protein